VIGKFVAAGLKFFVSTSFSKSFSLYGERVGALSVLCASKEDADRVLSQLKIVIRTNYSNPPIHGAAVVAAVLNNPELRAHVGKGTGRNARAHQGHAPKAGGWPEGRRRQAGHVLHHHQIGMFSYSGLSKDQMVRLRTEFGVYGTDTGRMCVAALNSKNIAYVCQSIAKVM
jgi:aromatic-amino-acid transaminase